MGSGSCDSSVNFVEAPLKYFERSLILTRMWKIHSVTLKSSSGLLLCCASIGHNLLKETSVLISCICAPNKQYST